MASLTGPCRDSNACSILEGGGLPAINRKAADSRMTLTVH
jgi:hypothetical protein